MLAATIFKHPGQRPGPPVLVQPTGAAGPGRCPALEARSWAARRTALQGGGHPCASRVRARPEGRGRRSAADEELQAHLRRLASRGSADLDPLTADEMDDAPPPSNGNQSGSAGEGETRSAAGGGDCKGCEPAPADGEGAEFSMAEVAHKTEGARMRGQPRQAPISSSPASSASPLAASAGEDLPPQDGHYHIGRQPSDVGESVPDDVDLSWECLEEPETVEKASSSHPPPHMPMYRGEPEEGEGYKEPGQDIASALPGRWGDFEDFGKLEEQRESGQLEEQ